MEMMCELWEDLQYHYAFEGLVLHCPGKENRLPDIGSRMMEKRMEAKLQEEMTRLKMTNVKLKLTDVLWRVGDIDIDMEPQLLMLRA